MKGVLITKRFISVLIVFLLMFSFALECYATVEPVIVTEYFEEYCDEYGGNEVTNSFTESMNNYISANEIDGSVYSSYSLLSDLEKEYYDRIVALDVGVLSFTVKYSPALPKNDFESINFTKIMYAVCLDHPEIFYYNGYGYTKSYYPSNGAVVSVKYNIAVKKHGQTNEAIYNTSNISDYYSAMMDEINNVSFNANTRYYFIKQLHDYLCNKAEYINDYASCYDAYGTLVNGVAVCQGYAETFKIFCDKYKIPCVCITGIANGEAHMWNAVQMDDGKWYLIDVTWDDRDTNGIFTDFLLVGLETKDTYFTGDAFNVSHVSDGSPYLPALPYSNTAFDSVNMYSGFGMTHNYNADLNNRRIILSFYDGEDNYIYFNGLYMAVEDYYTTAKFTAPTGKNNEIENWKMILIGDCNGDGSSDLSDYSIAVNKAFTVDKITTDFDIACDANFDGVIDALDIAILERAISGANQKIVIG
ncbi:MAG: hypothetical protein E7530_08435 [Ruminococcaceae bacterium]|nr:hypothetical protein [Oscillospiraceae bacterium]